MRRRGTVAAVVGVLALVGGCTADDPEERPTPSASASATQDALTVEEFAADVLDDVTLGDLPDLGRVSGEVGGGRLEAQVVAVDADEHGTELVLVLRGEDAGSPSRWSASRGVYSDLRGVEVVDPEAGWRLQPYTVMDGDGKSDLGCACSAFPYRLDEEEGAVLHALLPPLTSGVTSVTVRLPGLDPVDDVPVTWR